MKKLPAFLGLLMLLLSGTSQAQKIKIYRAKIFHYDRSSVTGIVYDVSPQGVVLLDSKAVFAMSAKDLQEAVSKNQLPDFTVPFEEIREMNIRRRGAAGRSFGLGYLASFVTLETIMATNALSSNGPGCDGSRKQVTVGQALIGASCAAPPGILVMAVVSVAGGGVGSFIGLVSAKQIALDPNNQEGDARKKLKKYALRLQNERT